MPDLVMLVSCARRWKKIFSSKTHGGKRDYAVALAIDVSQSVSDHTAQCIVASVVMMLAALDEIGVETVSIITFGAKITCVKTEDQPMDGVVVAALLSVLRFDQPRTRDAEAIECVAAVSRSVVQRFRNSTHCNKFECAQVRNRHATCLKRERAEDVLCFHRRLQLRWSRSNTRAVPSGRGRNRCCGCGGWA